MKLEPLPVLRMVEGEVCGVQQHRGPIFTVAVEKIADDRAVETKMVSTVQPQLMGTAGERLEAESGGPGLHGESLPAGDAGFAPFGVVNLQGAVFHIKAKGEADLARFLRHKTFYHCFIKLFHFPSFKLAGEVAVGRLCAGKDQQPGGCHIQPVHRRLLRHVKVDPAQPGGEAVLFLRASTWYAEKPAWFVCHNNVFICKNNFHLRVHRA